MKNKHILASVMLVMVPFSSSGEILPTRAECIVGITMHWHSGMSAHQRESKISKISEAIAFSTARGGPIVNVHQAFPDHDRTQLFLQFENNCERRFDVANELMDYVRDNVGKVPDFRIMGTYFEPGNETINVWGEPWRDTPPEDTLR